MSDKPKYEPIKPRPRAELEIALTSDDPDVVSQALFSAAQHESDWRWSQTQCLRMLSHKFLSVRSAALIALSEIALYRGHLDLHIVLPELRRLENDSDLAPLLGDALDNIRVAKIHSTS